jgi:hypothetical protein
MGGVSSKKSFSSRQTLLLHTQEPYNGLQLDGLPVIPFDELEFPYGDGGLTPRGSSGSGSDSEGGGVFSPPLSPTGDSGFLSPSNDRSAIGFGAAGVVRKAKFQGKWVALKAMRPGTDTKEFAKELENLRSVLCACVCVCVCACVLGDVCLFFRGYVCILGCI